MDIFDKVKSGARLSFEEAVGLKKLSLFELAELADARRAALDSSGTVRVYRKPNGELFQCVQGMLQVLRLPRQSGKGSSRTE